MTRLFRVPSFAVSITLLGWLSGCTSTDSGSNVAKGPDGFGIASVIAPASGHSATLNNSKLVVECGEPVLVNVAPKPDGDDLGGFLLAPPGNCGSTVDCGWLVLTVKDADKKILPGANAITSATSPIRFDIPNKKRNEKLFFQLGLKDSNNSDVLTDAGAVLSAEMSVDVSTDASDPSCQ
jgi:hypothetical protein